VKKTETSRRDFIKTSAAGVAIGTLGILGGQASQTDETGKNQIKLEKLFHASTLNFEENMG